MESAVITQPMLITVFLISVALLILCVSVKKYAHLFCVPFALSVLGFAALSLYMSVPLIELAIYLGIETALGLAIVGLRS